MSAVSTLKSTPVHAILISVSIYRQVAQHNYSHLLLTNKSAEREKVLFV